jgi:hypothetical protein
VSPAAVTRSAERKIVPDWPQSPFLSITHQQLDGKTADESWFNRSELARVCNKEKVSILGRGCQSYHRAGL